MTRRTLDWLPELLFLGVTTAVGIWAGGRWLDPTGDPGFSWSLGYRLAEGDVLYRDVYLAYTPLTPYLLAGLGRLFQFSAGYLVVSGWIAAMVAGVLILRCGRPFLSTLERIALAALVLAFSLWAPGPGRLVFPYYPGVVHALALALGAILIVRNARLSVRAQCALAGLLSGLAFLAKQELGIAALLALLASYLLRPREMVSRGAWTTAAFSVVVFAALGAILLVPGVTLDSLVHHSHLWPLAPIPPSGLDRLFRVAAGTVSPGWAFPVREAAWCLLAQLGLIASAGLLAARARKASDWFPVAGLASVLLAWWAVEMFRFSTRAPVALSCAVSFLVAALAFGTRKLEDREHLMAIGTFAGLAGLRAVFSPSLSGAFDGPAHFGASLTWVVLLCMFAPRILAPDPKGAAWARKITALFLLVSAGYGAAWGAQSLRFAWRVPVSTIRGTVFLDPSKAPFLRSLAREIRPGERLLVLPEISAVDVLFAARNVSPLQDHLPGWLDPPLEDELLQRFDAVPPDAVVIFNRTLHEYGFSRFGEAYGARISAWIGGNYRPVLADRVGSILRRKGDSDPSDASRNGSRPGGRLFCGIVDTGARRLRLPTRRFPATGHRLLRPLRERHWFDHRKACIREVVKNTVSAIRRSDRGVRRGDGDVLRALAREHRAFGFDRGLEDLAVARSNSLSVVAGEGAAPPSPGSSTWSACSTSSSTSGTTSDSSESLRRSRAPAAGFYSPFRRIRPSGRLSAITPDTSGAIPAPWWRTCAGRRLSSSCRSLPFFARSGSPPGPGPQCAGTARSRTRKANTGWAPAGIDAVTRVPAEP